MCGAAVEGWTAEQGARIIYTILERGDLERSGESLQDISAYLRKSSDLDMLARKIRDLVPTDRLTS